MSTRRLACEHFHIDILPANQMRCRDCGDVLEESEKSLLTQEEEEADDGFVAPI